MSDTEETKKRSHQDQEEIEIDLKQSAPLSKKQKRLLRKGKLPESKPEGEVSEQTQDSNESETKEKIEKFGVWIGNLSFDTSKDDLIRFITNKTVDLKEYSSDFNETDPAQVNEQDILRVNLPTQGKDGKKIKGFAYIDFKTKNHQLAVIKLSEENLNGRNLLIKDSTSFDGRPSKAEAQLSKNPPSRILFVGNLSFDTTEEQLTQHFQHCGEILKIRMATFEDSGKCKGFAFLDFRDEEGPTKALKDKSVHKLINRPLRMEFGEDRSKKAPKYNRKRDDEDGNFERPQRAIRERPQQQYQQEQHQQEYTPKEHRKPKKSFSRDNKPKPRPLSSVALASAQRASAAIVQSTGKKVKF